MALTPRKTVAPAPANEGTLTSADPVNKLAPVDATDVNTFHTDLATLEGELDPLVVEAEAEAYALKLAAYEQDAYELEAAMKLGLAELAAYDAETKGATTSYDTPVTITAGDLLDMHRMLGYCLRGNQRPTVLFIQQRIVSLLPPDTPLVYREPT
jgi:hypothetical protein